MHRAHQLYRQSTTDDQPLLTKHGDIVDRLARRLAAKVGNPSLVDDLWSAGALGLLDAAQRFDAAMGVRFETFAQHRVRGAMVDELRRLDHLPRRLRAEASKIAKTREGMAHELGRPAEDSEVANRLGLDEEHLRATEGVAAAPAPLKPEILRSLQLESVEDQVLRSEQARLLADAVATLPERMQLLLSLHYVEELSYREIAQVLEVSQPRVSQLHSEAVQLLREAMALQEAA
jgi:RNA polymerase sigma factor for flagellar operon FliA